MAESKKIVRVGSIHDAMIDYLIQNPGVKGIQIAKKFGYTASWVSCIMNSDEFKTKLDARRTELVDPVLRMTLEERIKTVTMRALEVLGEKLSAETCDIPDSVVLKALELGAKGLGIGGFASSNTVVNTIPPADHLNRLAENLLALQKRTRGELAPRGVDFAPRGELAPRGDLAVVIDGEVIKED